MEQTYTHMAILYKSINNINSSLIMWEKVLKVHQRVYGENNFLLSADYKNIGVWRLGVGKVQEAIEALHQSEQYSKIAIKELKEPEDILEEKKQLSEVYFSLYLSHVAINEWEKAISANESSMKLNIELLGENDLNVANNYYLGAQIFLKKLQIEEAMKYVSKANEIIDMRPSKEPLLLTRYRFLRAKLYKMMEKNMEALKDVDEAIRITEGNPQLYSDELEIKGFRRNLIAWLDEGEKEKLGINQNDEETKAKNDMNKKKEIENQIKKNYLEKSLKSQGIDPKTVNTEELMGMECDEEEEEEGFIESPLGVVSILGGILAIGAGIVYLWNKKK